MNPVLPGEGRWLTGEASARASEETGVQSDQDSSNNLSTESEVFFSWKIACFHCGRCVLARWCALHCGRVGTVERRSHERHQFNCGSTSNFVLYSKIVADTDVVAESVDDIFPVSSVWCFAMGSWRDGDHGTHTQWQGMAFKKYIHEIKRARGESMTSWINRSDEALMDMRKKLPAAPSANSSEQTMIPPQIQGWLLLLKARLRNEDIVGVMTMTGGSLNIKLVEESLLDLFTDDVLLSVDRSHGKDDGISPKVR